MKGVANEIFKLLAPLWNSKIPSCYLKSRDEVWIFRSQSNKNSSYENKEVINKHPWENTPPQIIPRRIISFPTFQAFYISPFKTMPLFPFGSPRAFVRYTFKRTSHPFCCQPTCPSTRLSSTIYSAHSQCSLVHGGTWCLLWKPPPPIAKQTLAFLFFGTIKSVAIALGSSEEQPCLSS